MNTKRSKRWDGNLTSLTPEYLNAVLQQMKTYGENVRFSLIGPGGSPLYQVINSYDKKMAFDANHHLLHPVQDEFVEPNVTPALTLERVQSLIANAGRKPAATPRTRVARAAGSSGGRTMTVAQTVEQNIDALKYAYYKEHAAMLPEEIKQHSGEITKLMKTGLSAEEAFGRILQEYFP